MLRKVESMETMSCGHQLADPVKLRHFKVYLYLSLDVDGCDVRGGCGVSFSDTNSDSGGIGAGG